MVGWLMRRGCCVCGWDVCMDIAADPCLYAECAMAEGKFGSRKGIAVIQFYLEQ